MNPSTRNRVLVVGGALILIALMLVCGPLEGRFGRPGQDTDSQPTVAARPPAPVDVDVDLDSELDEGDSPGAGGVASGGSSGSSTADSSIADAAGAAGAAAGAAAAGAAGAAGAGSGGSGGGGEAVAGLDAPPALTRGPDASTIGPRPVTGGDFDAAAAGPPVTPLPAARSAAVGLFDDALAAARRSPESTEDEDPAGRVADRFAPPVASPGPAIALARIAQPMDTARVLRPCDTPGSGCQNLTPSATPPPTNPFPPIGPGGRPVR